MSSTLRESCSALVNRVLSISFLPYAFVFLIVLYQSRTVSDSLWSIRLGQDFFAGENIWIERWSWTAGGSSYANHEWLFEIFLYGLYRLGGETFVLFHGTQGLLAALSFYLLRNSVKTKQTASSTAMMSLGYILGGGGLFLISDLFWEVRAQSFTLLFMALCFFLLGKELYRYIPLVFVIWANFHGGFILGCYMIFSAFLISLISYALERNSASLKRTKRIFFAGVFSFGATFLTPLTWRNWSYIFDRSQDTQAQSIIEFTPTLKSDMVFAAAILIVLYLVSIYPLRGILSEWGAKLAVIIPLLFMPLMLVAVRFIPPFFFLLIPLFFLASYPLPPKFKSKKIKISNFLVVHRVYVKVFVGLSLAIIVSIGSVISWINYLEDMTMKPSPGFSETLRDECSNGRIYNDYGSAGSILFWDQDVLLFIDNRYDPYSQEVRSYLDLSNPDWEEYLVEKNVSCAVVMSLDRVWSSSGELTKAGWPLLYRDYVVKIYSNPQHKPGVEKMLAENKEGS